jgi:hypothetical protein
MNAGSIVALVVIFLVFFAVLAFGVNDMVASGKRDERRRAARRARGQDSYESNGTPSPTTTASRSASASPSPSPSPSRRRGGRRVRV